MSGVALTALGRLGCFFPALTGWADFCHAYDVSPDYSNCGENAGRGKICGAGVEWLATGGRDLRVSWGGTL
ncbi:MAG: hypothetical protein ABSB66_17300 [Candidatus Acidiferrales bacterium]